MVLLLTPLSSCSSVAPHENFKSLRAHNVGSSIGNRNVAGSTRLEYLMESKSLSNGNIENEYSGRHTYRKFFEFNPKIRIIVSWRFEGNGKGCAIVS